MQKKIRSLISMFLAVVTAISLIAFPSSAASARLSRTSLVVVKGYSSNLKVSGASKVKWSSDNESVATVSSKGKVTGKKFGTATISADTGKTVLKCKVSVRAGKITANVNEISIDKGSYSDVSVKALGTHDLALSSTDKKIARATFVDKSFKDNIINLRIAAVNDGEARIKIYSKKYPKSVYKYIDVKAGRGKPVETVSGAGVTSSVDSIEVNENLSVSFTVSSSYIDLADLRIVSTNAYSFSIETSVNAAKNCIDVKVNGHIEDKGSIRITSDKNNKLKIIIPVTVTNNTYDVVVSNREPHKRANSDKIYSIVSPRGEKYYILEPSGGDTAHAWSLLSEAADYFEYDTVYETVPKKQEESDAVLAKTLNYKGKRVLRYILAEENYDPAVTNSLFAIYCGDYEYNTVYASWPKTKSPSDKVLEFSFIPPGKTKSEDRYIISSTGASNALTDKAWDDYLEFMRDR